MRTFAIDFDYNRLARSEYAVFGRVIFWASPMKGPRSGALDDQNLKFDPMEVISPNFACHKGRNMK